MVERVAPFSDTSRDARSPATAVPFDKPAGSRGVGPLTLMWRHRPWVIAAVGTCLACAAAYLAATPRTYRSSARLYVDQAGPVLDGQGARVPHLRSYLDTQASLIASRPVLGAAIENPAVAEALGSAPADQRVAFLRRRLAVEVAREGDLVTVSFEATDANAAAAVVNGVVDAYLAYQAKRRLNDTAPLLNALHAELRTQDEALRAKLDELHDSGGARANEAAGRAAASGGQDGKALVRQLSDYTQQLLAARLERIKVEAEAEAKTGGQDAPVAAAAARRAQAAQQKEKALEDAAAEQRGLLAQLYARPGGNAVIESEIRRAERLRAAVEDRIQTLRLLRQADVQPLRVWDAAQPPREPVGPRRLQTVASALVLGTLLGWGVALARDARRMAAVDGRGTGEDAGAGAQAADGSEADTRSGPGPGSGTDAGVGGNYHATVLA